MKSRNRPNTTDCSQMGWTCLSGYKLSLDPKSDTKLFNCLVENYNDLSVTNSSFIFAQKTFLRMKKRSCNVTVLECQNFMAVFVIWVIFTAYVTGLRSFLIVLQRWHTKWLPSQVISNPNALWKFQALKPVFQKKVYPLLPIFPELFSLSASNQTLQRVGDQAMAGGGQA